MSVAVVYERGGTLYLRSCSETTQGVRIEDGPCATIAGSAPEDEVARAVLAALAGSRSNVPHPDRNSWSHVTAPLLKAAGVKTFAAFAKSARTLSVNQQLDRITLTPTRNEGKKAGFVFIPDKALTVDSTVSEGELGGAVREGLARYE
jgi:hypothetical protein